MQVIGGLLHDTLDETRSAIVVLSRLVRKVADVRPQSPQDRGCGEDSGPYPRFETNGARDTT
ncbi:MAG: hypothetical protein ACYS1E_19680, partial [Planctomycetota bacterium]